MIAWHLACLSALTAAATRAIITEPGDDLGAPEIGLPVLMFAGELAAAVQPDEFRNQIPAAPGRGLRAGRHHRHRHRCCLPRRPGRRSPGTIRARQLTSARH